MHQYCNLPCRFCANCILCFHKKRSPCGRSITPRARTSMLLFYQTRLEMSIIWPRLLMRRSFLRPGRSFILFFRVRWIASSRTPLIREESIITFGHFSSARLTLRMIFFWLSVMGDLISYVVPSRKMSGVLRLASGINSTECPANAKILATRCSCGHGLASAGIRILPFCSDVFIYHIITCDRLNSPIFHIQNYLRRPALAKTYPERDIEPAPLKAQFWPCSAACGRL